MTSPPARRPGPLTALPGHRRRLLAIAAACLLAALVYANTLANGFALDDVWIIQENPSVHGIDQLPAAFSRPYWPRVDTDEAMYRPVTIASFILDWELWDGRAAGFHLVNILLHAAVTGLLLLLLARVGAGLLPATAGALLFAVHPVHVEAVANVVGRAELLVALFFMGACLLHARGRGRWGTAAGVAMLYFLALGSKEHAITLPAALLLVDALRERGVGRWARRVRAGWRGYLLLVPAAAAYFFLRARATGALLGGEPPPWFWRLPDHAHVLTALRVIPEYVRLLLVPVDLVPDYAPGVILPVGTLLHPLVLLGLLTAGVAALVAWRTRWSAPLVAGGIAWFAVTVLPVSGLLFPVGVVLAERTLYLPSAGLAMATAGAVAWVRARSSESLAPAAAVFALLLVAGAARTWTANPVWRDTASVMNHLLREHPGSYRAQWGLANELLARGDTLGGLRALERAIGAVPGHHVLRAQRGEILYNLRRYPESAEDLGLALQLSPAGERARVFHVAALLDAGRPAQAAASAAEGVARYPRNHALHHLHARALARAGRMEEASRARLESIALATPATRWAEWQHAAGLALLRGDTAAAAAALERAAGSAPPGSTVPALEELARLLESGGPEAMPLW